jgi:hypothetical protein
MVQIPTLIDGTQSYTEQVELDGVTFRFVFNWNVREGRWYFDLNDIADNPVVSGRAVTLNTPLLGYLRRSTSYPAGDLIVIDTSNSNTDASLTDLGDRVIMLYITGADLATIQAGGVAGSD